MGLLRKLGLPVKDLQAIFNAQDLSVAVESFLTLLREHGFNRADGLQLLREGTDALLPQASPQCLDLKLLREDFTMPNELTHVRILELKPLKVAAFRAESTTPEHDAWAVLSRWAEERGSST